MAGEIQLNSTSFASESGGTITINNATVGSAVAMSANQACVKTALNASGSAPIYACRAWINFDGSSASIGTGRANGNVSGVTDNGGSGGDYTITFATALPDSNYSVVGNAIGDYSTDYFDFPGIVNVRSPSDILAGSVRILTTRNLSGAETDNPFDSEVITVGIIR
jgi:hypothetical protein